MKNLKKKQIYGNFSQKKNNVEFSRFGEKLGPFYFWPGIGQALLDTLTLHT